MSNDARELFGVKMTVKASREHFSSSLVLVKTNDKVTQAYINHLRDCLVFLSGIAQDLWSLCYRAHILLVAVHRLGKVDAQAHRLSR